VLRLIHALVQYKTSAGDLAGEIRLLRLEKEKSDYLREVRGGFMLRK
jgi:hypothetical protein